MTSLRRLVSVLLLAAAALFVVGVAVERGGDEHHEGTEATESHEDEEAGELLGESNALVIVMVAVSVAVAAAVWLRRERWLLWLAIAFAAGFAMLDVLEMANQLAHDEGDSTVALIAGLVAALHAAAAFLTGALLLRRSDS